MEPTYPSAENTCRETLDRLCMVLGDRTLRERADKALRFLTVSQKPKLGVSMETVRKRAAQVARAIEI